MGRLPGSIQSTARLGYRVTQGLLQAYACIGYIIHRKADSNQSRIGVCHSAVNMSKWYWLAVVCLPVILLSSEADAQPTVDSETETTSCGSSALDHVAKEIRGTLEDVKKQLASNPSECHIDKQVLVSALMCECFVFF